MTREISADISQLYCACSFY